MDQDYEIQAFDRGESTNISEEAAHWGICRNGPCPIFYTHDLNANTEDPKPLGTVATGTKMGIFLRSGNILVVSFPMDDQRTQNDEFGNPYVLRNGRVQVTFLSGATESSYFWELQKEPTEKNFYDHGGIETIHCQKTVCPIYTNQNDLSALDEVMVSCDHVPCSLDQKGIEESAVCGETRQVMVKDSSVGVGKYVISTPMWDRNGSIQVVPLSDWDSFVPTCQDLGSFEDPETCPEQAGRIEYRQFQSRLSTVETPLQHYYVYLPPCYEKRPEQRYPSLYLIHGLFEQGLASDAKHFLRLGLEQTLNDRIGSGDMAPAIVVLPVLDYAHYRYTSGGPRSYEGLFVELVTAVDADFRTEPDPAYRAIGGISRGGVWSLEIAFLHPELFGAMAGHSPCLNLNNAPEQYDPLELANLESLHGQRIWLDAGDDDWCLWGAKALHQSLDDNFVEHDYWVFTGSHDNELWSSHLAEYLSFYNQGWPAR